MGMVALSALASGLDMDCMFGRIADWYITYVSFLSQVSPILIFQAWGVRDTMGWRTQTIACCLARYFMLLLKLLFSAH